MAEIRLGLYILRIVTSPKPRTDQLSISTGKKYLFTLQRD